jgi:hypothetical protein
MNLKELSRPLTIEDIDFRVQSINAKGYATILAYKSARIDMQRLDLAVGPLNWQRKHELIDGKLFCHVGIYNEENSEWVWKSDVGTESMTEATKGESSDSFKRACFNWGIGRELYDYPIISIPLVLDTEYEMSSGKARQKWGLKLRDWKWHSQFTDGKVTYLACKDTNGKLRFQWGEYIKEESQPKVQQTAQSVIDPEANVQGFLKKKTDLEILKDEYTRVIGKAPHHKLSTDKMKAEIEAKLNEELQPTVKFNSMFETLLEELVTIGTLEELKVWAKDKVEMLSQVEPDNVDMFKLACNNYVTKLKTK